jgi:surface protein
MRRMLGLFAAVFLCTTACSDQPLGPDGSRAPDQGDRGMMTTSGTSVSEPAGPADPVPVNTPVQISAGFVGGAGDTHTAQIRWGDGASSVATVTEQAGSGTATATRPYVLPGVYSVEVEISNQDGGSVTATFEYVTVFDPAGGYVSGNGTILSPEGACTWSGCVSAAGTARLGFSSRYRQGAHTPDGSTRFTFRDGNFTFNSTEYEWLVVAGARAQYKGVGTVNRQGDYGFLLTAIDSDRPGGGEADRVRIKVWDRDDGDRVVYDNQRGTGDDAGLNHPGTLLTGGKVTIRSTTRNMEPVVIITAPADGATFGDTQGIRLAATAGDAEDGDLSEQVTWTSSLAGPLGTGAELLDVGLEVGEHTITAQVTDSGGLEGSASVVLEVVEIVYTVSISPTSAIIAEDDTRAFTARVYANGVEMTQDVPTLAWSSSDEAVATVDAEGLATAGSPGVTAISAAIGDVSGSAVLTVREVGSGLGEIDRIAVAPSSATIEEGATRQFSATVYDENNAVVHGETVAWSSSDEAIATVDASGLASGVGIGEATITASIGDMSDQGALTVELANVSGAFVTRWDTSLDSGNRIALALAGTVDATIEWGDGTSTHVTTTGPHYHTYSVSGVYTVSVTGMVTEYNSAENGGFSSDRNKLTEVVDWGDVGFTSLYRAFESAIRLEAVPTNSAGIQNVTNMRRMFHGATAFNHDIGGWDTGNIETMGGMFSGARAFNQDIGDWDTRNVTDMGNMFEIATAFNQDIGGWDTGNVTNMAAMFRRPSNQPVSAFNQDIGGWDTGNVTTMASMFSGATSFNQHIGDWNTGAVTDMSYMFLEAIRFNHDIGEWDTRNVETMAGMFSGASAFNRDIGEWDTGKVTTMFRMFYAAPFFNQAIGGWDTQNVKNMNLMFAYATRFNQDIGDWDTGNVENMSGMFHEARAFNQNIGGWNTGSVTNMNSMFRNARAFNGDIGGWNTADVTNMALMFELAHAFNRNIGGWDTGRVTNTVAMFRGATAFNQDIGGWSTGRVTNMEAMFHGAAGFNQDVRGWDTGRVTNMNAMFHSATGFNQDLSGWCVERIASTPSAFDTGATGWVLSRPVWGTCPS